MDESSVHAQRLMEPVNSECEQQSNGNHPQWQCADHIDGRSFHTKP
jgi:hypothetical protein